MRPLQLVDTFLLDYNIGQALLLVFVLSTVGTLPLKSRHILGINATLFGLIFLLTPVTEIRRSEVSDRCLTGVYATYCCMR
ncbi:hypothetical protein C9J85_16175 [Haloferax sp. wsp5]|nr:hypothetical protein C9J85_16175 [Haloferax sp. wsp5]